MKKVNVAVGVVKRGEHIYVTLRSADQHQGGKWEFPGGKIEAGETTFEALCRELHEEIGIQVHASAPLVLIEHDYGDKRVSLDVHLVEQFDHEPYGKESQPGKWVSIDALKAEDFPAANVQIIEQLQY